MARVQDGQRQDGSAALTRPETPAITPIRPGSALDGTLHDKLAGLAKPPGSLGQLEALAIRLGLIQNTATPRIEGVTLLIFAGDHGLTAEGVSAYPASVTAAMVRTFLAGRASANALARAAGVLVRVIDAGVASDLDPHPDLIPAKIRHGSRNAAREPALTPDEVASALSRGAALAIEQTGADAIAIGEMGIGNTAAAALLMHRLLPAPLEACIGLGTGHDAAGLARKSEALARAAARGDATEPFEVLCEFGGCEIAMMAGAVLGAASCRRPVIVDGFIAGAAALAAIRLDPAARDYLVFAHRSAEQGHARLLAELGAEPLLDLGLRLGEGTGALLAVPLLRAAARLTTDVADLAEVMSGAV
jgi:nicotinate-nucleotide--dimethylbenzimidazole phosphoribosyltransferase